MSGPLPDRDWRPAAGWRVLRARAGLLREIRRFFHERGVLEVETPVCSRAGTTDPAIDSLTTRYTGPGAAAGLPLYLHTSPEFPMKRLLAAGSGPIYQICRVFRDGEAGRFHNPEFTLLEWYRPGFDLGRLMDEVSALVRSLLDSCAAETRIGYGELFRRHLGLDPHRASPEELRQAAAAAGLERIPELDADDRDAWLDLLMSHCIEPRLPDGLCFVHGYPASQAALARILPGDPPLAERFELYLDRIELANGFHELADATEQRRRFESDLAQRAAAGRPGPPMDQALLAALAAGLPDCSGVALGIDRLLMRITGSDHIDQVLAFPLQRA
ncbi:MAG TPA: EF-P lysine aminoacylase GenX [Sedimenticola thiotaurini]|uniref:EF-P lysine aminoacylase GenX n=2 Tax=Sedimenticola thiotaurini TaxID=1543721 RepID=A0A831RKH2_9GAMM|nr:EF-P lysine aminoacylase GenX [Sedimenticola thiotaurini]